MNLISPSKENFAKMEYSDQFSKKVSGTPEIELYSAAYFDCVGAFEALYCRTSIKGGAYTH